MLRLGIAGIGTIASDYIGLIAAGRVEHVALTALCSRNPDNIRRVCQANGIQAAEFTDYAAMLTSGAIDAVLICTPHPEHPRMVCQAVEAGIHPLVEKPVGTFCDDVDRAVEALRGHPELVCGVMYNRRASKAYRHIRQLVEAGTIGELVRATWLITDLYRTKAYYGSGAWRGRWQSEGGGILMTQASHQLDLLQWICGMPTEVLARCSTVGRPVQVENEAELFLTFPNGAHGHFIASAHESPGTNLLELCGTRGRITIRDDRFVEVVELEEDERDFAERCPDPFRKVPQHRYTLTFDDSDNKVQQAAAIQNFAEAVLNGGKPMCTLEEGLRSLQVIHGAYLSSWLKSSVCVPVDEADYRGYLLSME